MIILLDNSMLDDGSFDSFNYWVADCDGCYQVGSNEDIIQHLKADILKAQAEGKSHLSTRKMELVYGGCQILEIQWG